MPIEPLPANAPSYEFVIRLGAGDKENLVAFVGQIYMIPLETYDAVSEEYTRNESMILVQDMMDDLQILVDKGYTVEMQEQGTWSRRVLPTPPE